MKRSNYHELVLKFKEREWNELKAAVMAHGGFYEWNEAAECLPCVCVNLDSGPRDVIIGKVWYDCQNSLEFEAYDCEDRSIVEIDFHDIILGHCDFIIGAIPKTENVSDVSVPVPFEWTDGALITLQHLSMYAAEDRRTTLDNLDRIRQLAEEFYLQESPEGWSYNGVDYETVIYEFYRKKF